MMRGLVLLAAFAALAGCGSPSSDRKEAVPAPETPAAQTPAPAKAATPAPSNPALDAKALESRNCADVMDFYAQAIQAGDFVSAAKVWNKASLPKGGLVGQFAGYGMAKLAAGERTEEGAAGSLYCEVAVTLTDEADPRKAPVRGAITFRRVNDVDGATPEQLRWHIEKSAIDGIKD